MDHYRSCHPDLVPAVERYRKYKNDDDSSTKKQMTLKSIYSPLTDQVVSIHFHLFFEFETINHFLLQFRMALLKFIVNCNLAFSVIQQSPFSMLINTVAGKPIAVPSTTTFMMFLKDVFEEMKIKLIELLKKQQYICVTCESLKLSKIYPTRRLRRVEQSCAVVLRNDCSFY